MTLRAALATTLTAAALSTTLLAAGCGGTSTSATSGAQPATSATPTTHVAVATSAATSDHHGLPRMFPVLVPGAHTAIGVGQSFTAADGAQVSLVGGPGGPGGVVRGGQVEVTRHGRTVAATVPDGLGPALFEVPVRFGHGVTGWMLSQEGGDSDQRHLYVEHAGRLVAATVEGSVPFGGGFLAGGDTAFSTWMTRDGSGLFTSVGSTNPGAEPGHVYRWSLRGTRLTPHDLGKVCIAGNPASYGRC